MWYYYHIENLKEQHFFNLIFYNIIHVFTFDQFNAGKKALISLKKKKVITYPKPLNVYLENILKVLIKNYYFLFLFFIYF